MNIRSAEPDSRHDRQDDGRDDLLALARSDRSVQDACEMLGERLGVHVVYHLAQTPGSGLDVPYVRTTYPPAWVGHYVMRGYISVDPVVRGGLERALPFDWSELPMTPEAEALFREAVRFGLGASGYSIPVTDKLGRRALFSINGMMVGAPWNAFVERHRATLIELANALHTRVIREIFGQHDGAHSLNAREIECLGWVARGKEAPQIAAILKLSPHTVRGYLKSARHKLDCTRVSQAVMRARQLRILSDPQFEGVRVGE